MSRIPNGSPIALNTYTDNLQQFFVQTPNAIAMDAQGNFIVTWSSFGQDAPSWDVYARRFTANGTPLGSEFRVNDSSEQSRYYANAAMSGSGDFLVTWQAQNELGLQDAYARLYYNAGGNLQSTEEFLLPLSGDGNQQDVSVAIASNRTFVTAWSSNHAFDGSGFNIYLRAFRYDDSGDRIATGETLVHSIAANRLLDGDQNSSNVAINDRGDVVVVWTGRDSSGSGIYLSRYRLSPDAADPFNLVLVERDRLVNTFTNNEQRNATVALDPQGNFVVTWTSLNQVSGTSLADVFARRYSFDGNNELQAGSVFQVNQSSSGNQENSRITMLPNGSFIITWESANPNQDDIFARRYNRVVDAQGNETLIPENEFLVHSERLQPGDRNLSTGNQTMPAIASDASGNYAIAFNSDGQDGDSLGVFAQRFLAPPSNAPNSLTLSASTVLETFNPATETAIGTLSATDPDGTTPFIFSLPSDTLDNNLFTIRNGNQLLFQPALVLDHENRPSYQVRVRVTDLTNLSFEQVLTINVENVNEAPTAIALSQSSFAENLPAGSVVGSLSATDPDRGSRFTYSLVDTANFPDNAAFTINGDQLQITASPNFEAQSSYQIRVRVSDGTLTFEQTFELAVSDQPEAPTDIALSNTRLNENLPAQTVVGSLSTTDPDRGSRFTYSLVDTANFPDNDAFTLEGDTLKINASPDFEAQPSYTIRIRVSDGTLSYDETFAIALNDQPEAPTDIALSNTRLTENLPADTVVGSLSATDPDRGSRFTYSLVDSANFPDNAAFRVEGDRLRITPSPNFETQSRYQIRLRVSDGALTYDETFTINIDDQPEAPTDIALSNTRLIENAAIGTLVGSLSATDPDSGSRFTYSLVDSANFPDNAAFTIDGDQLRISASPDFERQSSYRIRLRVSDGALTYDETFTIAVDNRNEAPTRLDLSNLEVFNGVGGGSLVGRLRALDPDGDTALTYALVAGEGDDDNAAFSLGSGLDNGNELRINRQPNITLQDRYRIRVQVRDAGGAVFEQPFVIAVLDRNEPPTGLSLSNTNMVENASQLTVGRFIPSDPDPIENFTYAFVDGPDAPDNAAFTLENGELRLNASPDFESQAAYQIRVRLTDRGGQSIEQAFTIRVQDQNEAPTALNLSNRAIAENISDLRVGTFSTTDPDRNETFRYELVDAANFPDNAAFLISGSQLWLRATPNFEAQSSYQIRVRVTDQGNEMREETFEIGVGDRPEPPTALFLSNSRLNENVAAGTIVGSFSNNDPDRNETFRYELVSGPTPNDNSAFTLDGDQLRINSSPDFETKSSYSIRVRVTDQNNFSYTENFAIAINDQNELPTALSLSSLLVRLGAITGTAIGVFQTTDPDRGDQFTYTLVDGVLDNSRFRIDGDQLRVQSAPVDPAGYTIRVRSTDQNNSSVEQNFTIMVSQVNSQPTGITLNSQSISENAALGAVVGTFTTLDRDPNDRFTYTLVLGINSSGNSAFTIANNQLVLNRELDFETQFEYVVRVRSTDAEGAFVETNFVITVLDGNDRPTSLSLSASSVLENAAANSMVGSFTTTDPNGGDRFTYTLVEGEGATDNGSFRIDNGQLQILSSPDFETKSSYSIRVRSTDQGGLWVERSLTLLVGNQNEAPTDLSLTPASILENVAPETIVGTLTSIDPDTGNTLTYSLVNSIGFEDGRFFRIAGNQLQILTPADFETKPSYRILVRSTDQDGLSLDKPLTITVQDVNDSSTSNAPNLDLNGVAAGINTTIFGEAGLPIRLLSETGNNAATLTDDSILLTSALVIISNLLDGADEFLAAVTTGTNIQATYSSSGALSLTGVGTLSQYLQVLNSVTYTNLAVSPNPNPRTILFLVNDGNSNSPVATLTLDFAQQSNVVNGSDEDDVLNVTTSQRDVINGRGGNDTIATEFIHLLQNDSLTGGDGFDALAVMRGDRALTVEVGHANQMGGLVSGTVISGFERFDFSAFGRSVTLNGSNTLNDDLIGSQESDTLSGAAGNDTLTGHGGNDWLNGGVGADLMIGGLGDDTYEVENGGDRVVEQADEGIDTVRSAIDYSLVSSAVENLTLTGNALEGMGNGLANLLRGNAQNNILRGQRWADQLWGGAGQDSVFGGRGPDWLNGEQGNDILTSGRGMDTFVLSAAAGSGVDLLTDFDPLLDSIQFERTGFQSQINTGAVTDDQFHRGTQAQDGGDRFIYNSSSGALFFDPDGSGSIAQIQIATLQNLAALEARHLSVVA